MAPRFVCSGSEHQLVMSGQDREANQELALMKCQCSATPYRVPRRWMEREYGRAVQEEWDRIRVPLKFRRF